MSWCLGVSFLKPRGDVDVWPAQQAFDENELADVVAFVTVAEILQEVAEEEQEGGPPPEIPAPEPELIGGEQKSEDREGDSDHVQPERDGSLMAQAPVANPA